jgi:enoyl-CoA hydratase/carnithine racemase
LNQGLPRLEDLLLDPTTLEAAPHAWADSWPPLGFVDLKACPSDIRIDSLPPFPLIGLGDAAHPLAPTLDAIVESPVLIDALIHQAARTPHAAAVAAQLLRGLDALPTARALQFESACYGLLQGSDEHARWLATRAPLRGQSSPAGRVLVDRRGAELTLTLDRPCARNAIDRVMRDQLGEAFAVAAADREIGRIKLRARGAAFSVGGELEEFGTTRDPATAHLIRSRSLPALAIGARASLLDVHVAGACVGAGLEIAAFAARLTASSRAWFQLPELALGLIPGAGGCVSVPGRIGRQRTLLMILSGRRINARTALRWGLIDAIEDEPLA